MKITLAIAALASTNAYGVRFYPDAPLSQSYLQTEEQKIEEKEPYFGGYTVGYSGFEGNLQGGEWRDAYERVLPERFDLDAGAQADSFTGHMIKDFAVEGQDKDTGKPNGKFFMDKAKTKSATYEVLATHLGLKGADAEAHLAKYFDAVWDHYDVNRGGSLEAVELNHFMRDLCKPVKDNIILE